MGICCLKLDDLLLEARMSEITPELLCQVSPAYWAQFNEIKLQGGVFSFVDHEYQPEPMQSQERRICYMKATQGGFSELEILKTLHGLIHKRYEKGALYLFPTTDDMRDFSKARFNPLIQQNKDSIGQYVKAGGKKSTDTAGLKKVHDAFLYLRGATLATTIGMAGDEKESGKLRGVPVDRVVFDEVELMNPSAISKAIGRMGHSKVKEEVYISNPGLPDHGIDLVWQQSDQRHWYRKCVCGEWMSADLTFPECVHLRDDGTGYIACPKCGKPVPMWSGPGTGKWVQTFTEDKSLMHGYHWSHLNSVYNDPAEVLKNYLDPPQGNIDDVYRLQLGLPHVQAEDKLSANVIRDCCGRDPMPTRHTGQCAMGVDVGKIKHVVIGVRTGNDGYRIVKVAQVSKWSDIHDLGKRYGVKSAVIDSLPSLDSSREFQKAETYSVFLCQYSENSTIGIQFNRDSGIVKANRTEICDATHALFAEGRIQLPRGDSPSMKTFITQVGNVAKVLEQNKRTGEQIFRYRAVGTGGDHYRHALNYFLLAAGKIAPARKVGHEQLYAIHEDLKI